MGMWSTVERAAASEFGRRHYRGVLAFRVARAAAMPVLVMLGLVAVAVATVRWVVPAVMHGAAAGARWSVNLVPAAVIAVGVVVGVPVAVVAWRRWGWLLEIRAPWVTGRVVSTTCGVLVVAVVAVALVLA